ncbi:MAG: energy transducer TonB [Candidatus Kapaibacterium sp.]
MAQTSVVAPKRSDYGAVELIEQIKKYTWRGFFVTVALTALFLLAYFFLVSKGEGGAKKKMPPIVKVTLENLPPPTSETQTVAPPPPTQTIVNTGPAARAGTPVPVPDAQITADMQDFAKMEELSRASAEGGTGEDLGGFASNIDFSEAEPEVDVEHREEIPPPDTFIPTEKEPAFDMGKIRNLIQYPDLAKRAGVEGQVIVRVFVDKTGEIKRPYVEYTDSELLNEAALNAVKNYGKVPPAIQNEQPIGCWVSIPIKFKLR